MKAQGMFRTPGQPEAEYSAVLELDMGGCRCPAWRGRSGRRTASC